MKYIKKIIICLMMLCLMTACASPSDSPSTSQTSQNSYIQDGDNILITYFASGENSVVDVASSASVTQSQGEPVGIVHALANMIQDNTNGELFSITTSVQYPQSSDDVIDYAQEEQDQDVRPELTSHIDNLEDYDVIFVGYPIWWYDLPQVMYSFFDEYDFSGKTIIPFCSHAGSQFSSTIETIQELEPDAQVVEEGLTVSAQDVDTNPDETATQVKEWIDSLE